MTDGATPDVGAPAPDIAVRDHTGSTRRLSELADGRSLVLLFYRGHW